MKEEMTALEKNKTWGVMTRPKGKQPIGCKWIYISKYKADGSLKRYKTISCKGIYTNLWRDYHKIFTLVANMNTVKILLSLAVMFDCDL